MNPWISAAMGALAGHAGLVVAVLWLFNLCLPVSAHQIKWQCEATYWLVALAYFAATFVATFFAGRRQIAVGLIAFVVLFAGHALVPDLAIASFGKRWYLDGYTLFFALIPAMVGATTAILARRRTRVGL
jgi:hypothetical protein